MKRNDDYRDGGSLLAGSRILFPPSLSLRLKRESSSAVAWRVVRDAQTIGHFPTEGGTLQGRVRIFPPSPRSSRWDRVGGRLLSRRMLAPPVDTGAKRGVPSK